MAERGAGSYRQEFGDEFGWDVKGRVNVGKQESKIGVLVVLVFQS